MEHTEGECGCTTGEWEWVTAEKHHKKTIIKYCPKHKGAPDMYEALKALLGIVRDDGKRPHHSLCYGIDIEPHPDCELCKSIAVERMSEKALARAEGNS